MNRGKSFDDYGGGQFYNNGFRRRVTRTASQFGRIALMFCFPFDKVNRDHQRLTNSKRGYREKNELTVNPPKMSSFV